MIHRVGASDPRFEGISFRPGLNVLLADRTETSADRATRNGAGKTSLIYLLHFLLGGNVGRDSIFVADEIAAWKFFVDLDVGTNRLTAERSGSDHGRLVVTRHGDPSEEEERVVVRPTEWCDTLASAWFAPEAEGSPTVRSLLSYLIRRVDGGGFASPFKQHYQQQPGDWQTAVSYLLGLDWRLAAEWQKVRDQEKAVASLRRAMSGGALGRPFGSVAELRTEVALADDRIVELRNRIDSFRVVESFRESEQLANQLTQQIAGIRDAITMDRLLMQELRVTVEQESAPGAADLTALYEAAGVQLGDMVRRRFDEVAAFHRSVVENRARHLEDEIARVERRISTAEADQETADERRRGALATLKSGGALEELTTLQQLLGREEARAEGLRQQYDLADQLESGRATARESRQRLLRVLQEDQRERDAQLRQLIRAFEDITAELYEERVGSLQIGASENGPTFDVAIDAGRSRGISNMQVFSFDILVAQLLQERGIGPGFLVHDSHLFDGVDERQVARALAIGEERSTTYGFQYVVTLNSDAVPREFPQGFNFYDYVLDVKLTDATEDGGLFGLRF